MKMFPLLASLAFIGFGAAANANTTDALGLLILQDGSDGTKDASTLPKKADTPSNLYLKADVGLNLLEDTSLRETGFAENPRLRFQAGIDANIGLGINMIESKKATHVERLSMEFTVGVLWNDIDTISSNTENLTPQNPIFGPGWYSITGGEGRMLQIPLNVDFVWTVYETERISVALNIGLGVQWTDLDLKNTSITQYSGNGGAAIQTTNFSASGSSVGFHYQGGFDVLFEITTGVQLGGYFRYAGTPASSMGTITGPAIPFGELKINELSNFSVGGRLTFAF